MEDFNKALELDFNFPGAYLNRGILYDICNNFVLAENDFNKCIDLKPDCLEAYMNRGISYQKQGYYGKAIHDFNLVIMQSPYDVLSYHNRGNTYMEMGSWQMAIKDFKKVIQMAPGFFPSYFQLGWLYATTDDPSYRDGKKAVQYALKAINLTESPMGLFVLGAAYTENTEYQKALGIYKKLFQKNEVYLTFYQKFLKKNHYYSGLTDGIYTPHFEEALRKYIFKGKKFPR